MIAEQVTTTRLRAERPRRDHLPLLEELFADPRIGATLWPPPLAPVRARALLDEDLAHWDAHGFGPWVAFESGAGGRFVGHAGLRRGIIEQQGIVEVLYAIHPDLWGRGYATELAQAAVEHARALALSDVVGFTLPANAASRRVLEKTGLRFERTVQHAGLAHWFGRLEL